VRHLKRREQAIKWLTPTLATGSMGSVTVTWTGTPATVYGDVQPLQSSQMRAEYGERADRMRLVFVPNSTYKTGDGIWLEGENTADPPWLIVSVAAWQDLTALTIEKRA
jgi:hypothetical protein